MRKLQVALAALAAAVALGAGAQVRPTIDYTDMWWDPQESGWGISIRRRSTPPRREARATCRCGS
jgi:hypothetical protein